MLPGLSSTLKRRPYFHIWAMSSEKVSSSINGTCRFRPSCTCTHSPQDPPQLMQSIVSFNYVREWLGSLVWLLIRMLCEPSLSAYDRTPFAKCDPFMGSTLGTFSVCCTRETTVTSSLLSFTPLPFWKGGYSKKNVFSPSRTNYLFLKWILFQREWGRQKQFWQSCLLSLTCNLFLHILQYP